MTLSELRTEVWRLTGLKSELDPATAEGAARLDRYINFAYHRILTWKYPNGRRPRFPVLKATTVFKLTVYTGTATSGTSTSLVIPTSGLVTTDDYYIGWLVRITAGTGSNQTRYIVDWVGATGTVTPAEAWDTTPDSTSEFLLTKSFVRIVDSGDTGYADGILIDPEVRFQGPSKVTDLVTRSDLVGTERTDSFSENLVSVANPTRYYVDGERLVFDGAPEEDRWYRLEYEQLPALMTTTGEEPQMPEVYQQALVLQASWWLLKQYGETADAYSMKRDLYDFMQSVKDPEEDLFLKEPMGFRVEH